MKILCLLMMEKIKRVPMELHSWVNKIVSRDINYVYKTSKVSEHAVYGLHKTGEL